MFVSILQRFGFQSPRQAAQPIQSRASQRSRLDAPTTEGAGIHPEAASQRRQAVTAKPVKTSKPATKAANKPKTAAKPVGKPVVKLPVKLASKLAAKPTARAAPKPMKPGTAAKPVVKALVKPLVKKAAKPPLKLALKATPVTKKTPTKAVSKVVIKGVSKAVAKVVVKAVSKAVTKPTSKKPESKAKPKAAAKALVKAKPKSAPKVVPKAAVKPVAKSATVTKTVVPVVKTNPKVTLVNTGKKPEKMVASVAVVVAPAPAKPVVQANGLPLPPPLKPGRRSSSRALAHMPPPAPMVPTHAPDAAKASYSTMTERVIAPPPHVAAKKDPKLANNWKSKTPDTLTDEEVKAMPDAEYMNEMQMAFFRRKLSILKRDIHNSAGATTEHLREDTTVVPDPADRATIEEEHALELRTRDRERKLLKKIEQSIGRIDSGDYGYCDETGEPIGVGRLIARPTASLSLEAQQRRELKQKMFGD